VNDGSSSLKFTLYEMPGEKEIVNGYIEKIGREDSFYSLKFNGQKIEKQKVILDHVEAVRTVLSELSVNNFINNVSEIKGVGHRILHGGEFYSSSVLIDEESFANIKSLTNLGKKHMPAQIAVVESVILELGIEVPQVAVFDTAFHQSMPKKNYTIPVPKEWNVRNFGFHGTSYDYVVKSIQNILEKKDVNAIIIHAGSGVSCAAVLNGKCYMTSMGLTPLDGVIMGTRSGAIDPGVIDYVADEKNVSLKEIFSKLNNDSGLKAICGENDCRDVDKMANEGNEDAQLAMEMFQHSVADQIARYYSRLIYEMNKDNNENDNIKNIDCIVFTAGVGENNINFRNKVIEKLKYSLGVKLDQDLNNSTASFKERKEGEINTQDSNIKVLVVPTNEELMILKDTKRIIEEKEYENSIGSNGNTQRKVL